MRRVAILLSIVFLAVPALAQAHHAAARHVSASEPPPLPPDHFKLLAVTIHGTNFYSDREILAATQLAPGQVVTQDDLQQASNRLGSSGVFSTVAYQFMGAVGGVRVTFDVTDNPQVVPVTFQNLVWLPDDALVDAVRQRVPLFKGRIPLAGDMMQQVRDALQAILAEKGVKARVTQVVVGGAGKGATVVAYQTDDVDVKVAAVDFAGRSAMDQILLDQAVVPLKRDRFLLTGTAEAGERAIQNVYLARGYLGIKVADPQVTVVDPSPTAPAVKLTFPIEEGKQYNFAGLAWTGNTAYSAAELSAKLSLSPGKPVNLVRLRQEVERNRYIYARRGYMAVAFDAVPQLHDDGTATILINVREGPQYKMGELMLKGLDPATERRLRAKWAIPPGAAYDDSYSARFINDTIGLLPSGVHYRFQQTTKIDDELRTVDVILEYRISATNGLNPIWPPP